MTTKEEVQSAIESIQLAHPRSDRERLVLIELARNKQESLKFLFDLYIEKSGFLFLDILIKLDTTADSNGRSKENVEKIFNLIKGDYLKVFYGVASAFSFLRDMSQLAKHRSEILEMLKQGTINCKNWEDREKSFFTLNSIMSVGEKLETYLQLFKNAQWGVQRKIIIELRKILTGDVEVLNLYLKFLDQADLNFGVRYDLWRSIFLLLPKIREKINQSPNRATILRSINTIIANETSIKVILGYHTDITGHRYAGIIDSWIQITQAFPECLESLANHKSSYVFDGIVDYINTRNTFTEQFSFVKSAISFILGNVAGIRKYLDLLTPLINNDFAQEIIQYLSQIGHQASSLYYKAILLQETDRPYLSVKFGIIGIGSGGKTTLSNYLAYDKSLPPTGITYGIQVHTIYLPEMEGLKKELGMKEKAVAEIKLFDFGGQNFFWASHKFFFQKIKGFITIFSGITGDDSIAKATRWIERVNEYYTISPPIFLVRTKMDMARGEFSDKMLETVREKAVGKRIFQVWPKVEEKDRSNIGKGIMELKKAMFLCVNWNSLQKYNLTAPLVEIIKFIKEKLQKDKNLIYITKDQLKDLISRDLKHIHTEVLVEELEKSLIKLEEDGDVINYDELIILNIEKFSQFTSRICQEAQDHNGIIYHNDIFQKMFLDIFEGLHGDGEREYLIERIMSILINRESCFPDFIEQKAVYIFYEDIKEDFPEEDYSGRNYDLITWIESSTQLKKGSWEKMVILISLTNGFHVNSIWRQAFSINYKYHQINIRKFDTKSKESPLILEILIRGAFSRVIGVEIRTLLMTLLEQEFSLDPSALKPSDYFRGFYGITCPQCKEKINSDLWVFRFLRHKEDVSCPNCLEAIQMVKFSECPQILEEEDISHNLYAMSKHSYSLFITKDYSKVNENQIEELDEINEMQKNHLADCYRLFKKYIGTDLLVEKAILPDVSKILPCRQEDLDIYYKARGKGTNLLKNFFQKVIVKLRIKKFLKIIFVCRKCHKEHVFMLVIKNISGYIKYLQFAISIALRIAGIKMETLLIDLAEIFEKEVDIKKGLSVTDRQKFDLKKYSQKDRELLIQSLEELDHINHIFDTFPDVEYDRSKNEFYSICYQCASSPP